MSKKEEEEEDDDNENRDLATAGRERERVRDGGRWVRRWKDLRIDPGETARP